MRFFKDRYFKIPPLTKEDWAALGFKEKDEHRTPTGAPTAQAAAETFLKGRGDLGVRIVYVAGDPHDRANGGFRIWYSVIAPGETPPAKPEDLRKSFFTRRKKDCIEFDRPAKQVRPLVRVRISPLNMRVKTDVVRA